MRQRKVLHPIPHQLNQVNRQRLRCNQKPQYIKSLVNNALCNHNWHDGLLTIDIPRLALFDAVLVVHELPKS